MKQLTKYVIAVSVFAILCFVVWMILPDDPPERKAMKLFEQRKYQEVLLHYPNSPIAADAEDSLAEVLFNAGKYSELLATYPGSRVAQLMRDSLAKKLFLEKRYQIVIDKFPDTEACMKSKEELAKVEFDSAMKIKDEYKRVMIFADIIRNYAGTQTAAKACMFFDPEIIARHDHRPYPYKRNTPHIRRNKEFK